MNPFSESYKTISDSKLISILQSPGDYDPLAIEAAREELNRRQLSEQDVNTISGELNSLEQQKKVQAETKAAFMESGKSYIDVMNPFASSLTGVQQLVRSLTFLFVLYAIYFAYLAMPLTFFILFENEVGWDFYTLIYMIPIVLLMSGAILFLMRKPGGWILMMAYVVYTFMENAVWLGYSGYRYGDEADSYAMPDQLWGLLKLSLFATVAILLGRKKVREVFKTDDSTLLFTVFIAAFLPIAIFIVIKLQNTL